MGGGGSQSGGESSEVLISKDESSTKIGGTVQIVGDQLIEKVVGNSRGPWGTISPGNALDKNTINENRHVRWSEYN